MRPTITALLFIMGCYQSHEPSLESQGCESLEDCGSGEYCELRFFCLEDDPEFGGFNCNPIRENYGCSFLEGRIVCDDPSRNTGIGLCMTPQECDDVFYSSRWPCSQIEVNP